MLSSISALQTSPRYFLHNITVTLLSLLAAQIGAAADWPGWRGPEGTGHTSEKELPLVWGGKSNENVLWKAEIGGRSYCSPAVWGDRVFVTTAPKQTDQEVKNKVIPEHLVVCYQASDGKELWRSKVEPGSWPDGNSLYSVPTPVTDGKSVFVWFGSGVAAALDFAGKIIWRKEIPGPYNTYPSISSSPLLYDDSLLLLCDQNKNSFLLALNKKDGAEKWKHNRPDARSTNSTPILIKVGKKDELVISGGNRLEGVDPRNGERLWWCAKDGGYWTSLAFGSGLVYADSGGGRGLAVDPSGEGDVGKTKVKWTETKVPEGLGSPIIVDDYVYRSHKPGFLKCWKLSTGDLMYSERLEGISFLSSPIATADGRIYFASPSKSYVIKAGPKLEVLATNTLPGADDGPSPALSGGKIFLKSSSTIFCVGKK